MVSSEASWNSQTGFLVNPPAASAVEISMASFPLPASDDHRKKRMGAAKKWILGRKCCCSGKKSVQVKEATSDSNIGSSMVSSNCKSSQPREPQLVKGVESSDLSKKGLSIMEENKSSTSDVSHHQRVSATGGFSFPILNPNSQSITSNSTAVIKGILKKSTSNHRLEDPPRDSLEIFQPTNEFPSFSGIENPVKNGHHLNTAGSPIAREDDMCSDASSDLFEIESFSTQTTPHPVHYRCRRSDSFEEAPTFNARRFAAANGLTLTIAENQFGQKSLDEPPTPCVAVTECYEPSEVSIDWSVTTAEGFDKASVSNFSPSASQIGSSTFLQQDAQEDKSSGGGENWKKKGNGGGGILLMSCRQEKAVSVGPPPVKCAPALGAQNFAVNGDGRTQRTNKPPLGNSHLARLSLAFAA